MRAVLEKVCEADGCWQTFVPTNPGVPRRYCSVRCRKRDASRRKGQMLTCAREGCEERFWRKSSRQRFCSPECREPPGDDDFELSPYWKEYLRRFDRAIFERTDQAWAACSEMVAGRSQRRHEWCSDPAFRDLLWTLRE
jgi:hypothetical protein